MTSTALRKVPGHVGLVALWLTVALFLTGSLPHYLTLDPGASRSVIDPGQPWHYPVLVSHILLGAVALLACCLQLWPWLRRTRPRVHRWTGRVYVAVALPGSLAAIAVAPLSTLGLTFQVGSVLVGVLWFAMTLAGYLAARRRDFARHREWMLRSFALVFAIATFRLWQPVMVALFAPEVFAGAEVSDDDIAQLAGVTMWLAWTVNLMIAEWWLHRRPRRTAGGTQRPATTVAA